MTVRRIRADYQSESRRWARRTDQAPLEVCSDPHDPSIPWSATLEDASEGGLAFWSKREFAPGNVVYVREFEPEQPSRWMPVRVVHYASSLRGYLTGVAFDQRAEAG
ncbi:MAG: PilZ domain-containing protein [Planctomycetota bacterium]|jgi:hypothetical protein